MGKILLFVLMAVVVWLLFKGLLKKQHGGRKPEAPVNTPERMVKCDICGVFMPESESIQLDEKRTCSTPSKCLRRQAS